ncbi:MAG: hypothetical protein IJW05_04085 [Lentisphaeria bacterium]|nr:hypothetical protein [Lentisphaeria bacterium]
MNTVLLRVLAVVLSGISPEPLEEKVVPFNAMPAECAAVYDADIRQLRQATATEVITSDLDGDSNAELLIFNGENGSGGEGWAVMRKDNGKYRKAGDVFGILYKSGNGLIVESPCGWTEATWSYYTIEHGKLACKFEITVKYSKPIRQALKEIIVKILK